MEPFKNLFSLRVIELMGDHLLGAWAKFPRAGFVAAASDRLQDLELKQRSEQIMQAMITFLPDDFAQAGPILMQSLAPEDYVRKKQEDLCDEGITGWAIMPMTTYVGLRGVEHFDLAMELMAEMTKRFTSEFGIRHLILAEPERSLQVFEKWVKDPNEHVRRLVSEGTRPRLPWAMQLKGFIADPKPVLPLLEALKDDDSEYVRRSVANHLNDIAKDHPDLVTVVAERWLAGEVSLERRRLVKHACRTLIKNGHQPTLKVLGYRRPKIAEAEVNIKTPVVTLGGYLEFEFELTSTIKKEQPLIIDYAVHHQKANGTLTAKVFKWKTLILAGESSLPISKRHSMREVSTRRYYAGEHRLEILINGQSVALGDFQLEIL
ncbi:MAG: DNA alkylation repair protein [Verrucomicrobiales bacterium]|nr:DNA alkylation repair protein [Verrucomicrobiales bacterium]